MTITKISNNDLDKNKELLQTGYWARFKEKFGWKAFGFNIKDSLFKNGSYNLLVLTRKIFGNYHIAYSPFPFEPEYISSQIKNELALKVKQVSEIIREHLPSKTVFLRYDLPWYETGKENIPEPFKQDKRFKKPSIYIQPLSTVILNIVPEDKEILLQMNKKTRYNIKLANKKGVKIIECGPEKLEDWYNLYNETKDRDKIAIHSLGYYKSVFNTAENYNKTPEFKLLLAEIEGEPVGGIIIGIHKERAYYLYGASSNRKRNYMPNHALQWHGIQYAKQKGCKTYDFCGIPSAEDPKHPMHGLYRFKTGFGGKVINRYGCYDYINKGFLYNIYRFAENMRNFYYKVIKKSGG